MAGKIGRTTTIYFVSQVGSTIAGFLATWFIANRLGSEILGEYSVIVAILFWLNVPATTVGRAMNKRMSESGSIPEYLGVGHALNGFCTVLLVAGIVVANEQINALAGGRQVAIYVAGLVAAQGMFDLCVESLRGSKQVGRSGLLKTLERVLRSLFQILVILASAGFLWLVIGHTVALLVASLIGLAVLRRFPTRPTRDHLNDLLSYARYSWLGSMKTRAFAWMDTLILGVFAAFALTSFASITHSQIGIYEVAWSLASTLGLLAISINQTLFPEISELSADGDLDQVRHLVREGLAFSGLFPIPGLIGAVLLGDELLTIYRETFSRGHWIFVLLVVAHLLSSYNRQYVNAISAIDRPDLTFRVNLLFLAFNLVANFVLIALFGWYGAAIATVLSVGLSVVIAAVVLHRLVGRIRFPIRPVGAQVAAAFVMGALIYRLRPLFPDGPLPAVLLVCVGAGVYGAVLFFLSKQVRQKATGLLQGVTA